MKFNHLFLVSFDLLPQQISWYVKVRLLLKLRLSLLLDIYKKNLSLFCLLQLLFAHQSF